MSDNYPDDQGADHRICNRIGISRVLLIELENGDIIRGRSRDLSPRGASMLADAPPQGVMAGDRATVFVISEAGQFSSGYPCRIVRLSGSSLALEIEKSAAAAFGNHIAKDLLGY